MKTVESKQITLLEAMNKFLRMKELSRSKLTMYAYRNGLNAFREVLQKEKIDPATSLVNQLDEDLIEPFAEYIKVYAPATEHLYMQAVKSFYQYVDANRLADINQSRVILLIRQWLRRPSIRFPQFPGEEIHKLLNEVKHVEKLMVTSNSIEESSAIKLRAYRDRAFLLTLADTGLRVHEACRLTRGDIDWKSQQGIVIGKGNKEGVIRFTTRTIQALQEYLQLRAALDGNSGRHLTSLPLFARHDKGVGKKIKAITTTTGRAIVKERVEQFLGKELAGKITPHSFRHYFVTNVLQHSGNLKLAQEFARHKSIQSTQRYAHLSDEELDKAYYDIFENQA
jgi:site-specific recombinase XerD